MRGDSINLVDARETLARAHSVRILRGGQERARALREDLESAKRRADAFVASAAHELEVAGKETSAPALRDEWAQHALVAALIDEALSHVRRFHDGLTSAAVLAERRLEEAERRAATAGKGGVRGGNLFGGQDLG